MSTEPVTVGALFAGYGGIELGIEQVFDTDVRWCVENDPAACAVLARNWPDVPNLGDVTGVDWSTVEPVDLLTGGFPCQDISNAGGRKGITGDRSKLWSGYADAIRALRPRNVLVENVAVLNRRGLDRVLGDLAALRFDAEWTVLRASETGAPHRRERMFVWATDADPRSEVGALGTGLRADDSRAFRRARPDDGGVVVADAGYAGLEGAERSVPLPVGQRTTTFEPGTGLADRDGVTADSAGDGRNERRTESTGAPRRPGIASGGESTVTDPDRGGLAEHSQRNGGADTGQHSTQRDDPLGRVLWGDYADAIGQWERIIGRPAPEPTVTGLRGGRVLNPVFVEWMMGLPAGHVTDVADLSRNDQLKILGNGVVPQQCALAVAHLVALSDPAVVA